MIAKIKNWQLPALILTVALVVGLILLNKSPTPETVPEERKENEHVHYHAGFHVYVNNELQDFSDIRFMHIAPCGEDEHEEVDETHKQIEKAHLHDSIGDVVHVHRESAVWGDLFTNINFPINPDSSAYINGQAVKNILDYPISAFDNAVIIQGKVVDLEKKLESAVTREHIEEVETLSEDCGE